MVKHLKQFLCTLLVVMAIAPAYGQKSYSYTVLDTFEEAKTLRNINWANKPTAVVPNYFGSQSKFLVVKGDLSPEAELIEVPYSGIDELYLFIKNEAGDYEKVAQTGSATPFAEREIDASSLVFEINDKYRGTSNSFALVAHSALPIYLPINQSSKEAFTESQHFGTLFFGAYLGVFIALLLYNLFLYFSTVDRSYLPYMLFLVCLCLAQTAIAGFGYKYLWPGYPWFNKVSIPLFSAMAGVFGLLFSKQFLLARKSEYRWAVKVIYIFTIFYLLAGVFGVLGWFFFSFNLLNIIGLAAPVFLLVLSVYIWRRGYKPAVYYFIAWCVFLISIITLALRNFGILPFNDFTSYLGFVGAGVQAVLLSLALADRINVLRAENEKAQAEALRVSRENERIIREQNEELERRVYERTLELQEANEELNVTLTNLKETQSQLVDAEKMASLGQLTAGIAHEINNPINFVTSNITPLRRDVEEVMEIIDAYSAITLENVNTQLQEAESLKEDLDYDYLKTEIDSLIEGIADGANRTKEIVLGLRTFSRLDEDVVKSADINEGLKSTLVLLKNKTKNIIEVVEDYDEQLEEVECFPGKLNQTFMNILNNGIYAVTHKMLFEEDEKPTITIKTRQEGSFVKIHLMDNGIGMDESTRKKMFDPFFTTKDVGEGTGLGMSIVFKIIEKHSGKIEVNSELGKGTEFIITLPMRQPTEFS